MAVTGEGWEKKWMEALVQGERNDNYRCDGQRPAIEDHDDRDCFQKKSEGGG
jgi:hypothetical protein